MRYSDMAAELFPVEAAQSAHSPAQFLGLDEVLITLPNRRAVDSTVVVLLRLLSGGFGSASVTALSDSDLYLTITTFFTYLSH